MNALHKTLVVAAKVGIPMVVAFMVMAAPSYTPGWPDPIRVDTIRSRTGTGVYTQTSTGIPITQDVQSAGDSFTIYDADPDEYIRGDAVKGMAVNSAVETMLTIGGAQKVNLTSTGMAVANPLTATQGWKIGTGTVFARGGIGTVSQAYSAVAAHTCVDVFTTSPGAAAAVGDACHASWVGGTMNVGCSIRCRITSTGVSTGTLCNHTTASLDCDGATTSVASHTSFGF